MPNTELLQRTLAQIEAHPEQWDQRNFASQVNCGTSYCFAGWSIALDHPTAAFLFEDAHPKQSVDRFADRVSLDPYAPDVRWISTVAQELLGLSGDTAEILFAAGNTLDELRAMVADLVAGGDLERFMQDDEDDDA